LVRLGIPEVDHPLELLDTQAVLVYPRSLLIGCQISFLSLGEDDHQTLILSTKLVVHLG
jgi:hypothetical protein